MVLSLKSKNVSIAGFCVMFLSFSLALWNEGMAITELGELLKWPSLILISVISLAAYKNNKSKKLNTLSFLVLVFIISIGISTVISPYINWGGIGSYILYIYLFFVCFIIPIGISGKDLNYILAISIGSVATINILVSAIMFMSPTSWWDGRFSGIFHNPNGMGSIALVALVSTISFRRKISNAFFWTLMFTSLCMVILSQSRAALLGLLVCVTMLSYKYFDLKKVIVSLLFSCAILVIYVVFFKSNVNFKSRDIVLGLDKARSNILDSHISLFLDAPYFGQGLSENINGGRLVSELAYADILSFSGVIGFTIFLLILLYVLKQGFKVFKKYDDYYAGNFLIFLSIIVMSLGEGYISSIGNCLPLFCWFYFSTFRSN